MRTPTLADSVRLDDHGVLLLDRRSFPFRAEWVLARTPAEVATAIRDMVTQSSGPLFAGIYGMVLAAREVAVDSAMDPVQARARLRSAAATLTAARPTNNHLRDGVCGVLDAVASSAADDLLPVVETAAHALIERYHTRSRALGVATAGLLADGARVLTHCWADSYLIETVRAAKEAGKRLDFFCTETRPYLQGARLTAHTLAEMGLRPTVITDGAAAALMSQRRLDVLLTAADRVSLDGHVINKIGTLGLAVAAKAFGVPFLAQAQAPDPQAPTAADVVIEERDPAEVLHCLGAPSASPLAAAYNPAFDVTPPHYVTSIVTDRGAFKPEHVAKYFSV